MTYVVLDTTEIHRNFHLRGSIIETLLATCKRLDFKLAIPEVVMCEHVRHYQEELEKNGAGWRRYQELVRIVNPKLQEYPSANDTVVAYRQYLIDWVKKNGDMPKAPQDSTEWLLMQSTQKKKPFRESGAGLKDALLWLSLTHLAQHHLVYFVTSNVNDFMSEKDLHSDLVDDLDNRNIPRGNVTGFCGIKSFLHEFVNPRIEALDELGAQFGSNRHPHIDLTAWTAQNLADFDLSIFSDAQQFGYPAEFDDFEITSIEDVSIVEQAEVLGLEDGLLLVDFYVPLTLGFTAQAWEHEVYDSAGEPLAEIEPNENFRLHYSYLTPRVGVFGEFDCEANIVIRVNQETWKVVNSDLISLKR